MQSAFGENQGLAISIVLLSRQQPYQPQAESRPENQRGETQYLDHHEGMMPL